MTEYVTIETADGPVRLPKGMTREQMAEALNKRQVKPADMSFMGRLKDNVLGVDDGVTSPGERAGQLIKGAAAGMSRGFADVAALPGNLIDLGISGSNTIRSGLGLDPINLEDQAIGGAVVNAIPNSQDARGALSAATGGASDYVAPGTLGEYVSTGGEFAGGAGLMAGPQAAVRYGAIPGVASEGAGQLTEGTKAEPYARIAAALGAGMLAGPSTGRVNPPGADPVDRRLAEQLLARGVKPTVGQVTGSPTLRKMEGATDMLQSQADDFTTAAMRTTGSSANRATPEALKAASDDIVRSMDDAVAGVTFTPSTAMASKVDDVLTSYAENTPNANLVPKVKNIADEILEAATSPDGKPIPLDTLKTWRSRIGSLLTSSDSEVRKAAWGLRAIIDDATIDQLKAAGRASDVKKLEDARVAYRNWLAVADASTRAGAEAGHISPTQLNQSVIRSQGRRNAAVGNTTDLGELSRAGAGLLRSDPTVLSGGARTIPAQLGGSLGGAAAGAAYFGQNPIVGALIGGLAGSAGVPVGQAIMRSQPIQSAMMDPLGKIVNALIAAGPVAVGSANK